MDTWSRLSLYLSGTVARAKSLLRDIYPNGLLVVPRSTPSDKPELVLLRLRSVLSDERLDAVAEHLYLLQARYPEVRELGNEAFMKAWGACGLLVVVLDETIATAANSLPEADLMPAAQLLAGSRAVRLLATVRPGSMNRIAAIMGHRVSAADGAEIRRLLGMAQ